MRVRFAPSPTGHLHVGNARTALFNWLLARGQGGTFVLRLEDTDEARSTVASAEGILEDLRWLGIDWHEGPDRGGEFGPTARRSGCRCIAPTPIACATPATRTTASVRRPTSRRREKRPCARAARRSTPGRAAAWIPLASRARVEAGEPAALRFRVPAETAVTFTDLVRGPITTDIAMIGDFVLLRQNGLPAYNFAVVVDDVAMRISLVVRGEDHVPNTPRQCLIYRALGETPPQFAHLSLVLGPDHAPLSKRHGASSVAEFRARGILPEALRNYLALLGWSPGNDEEILPIEELARRFRVEDVTRSAGVFDPDKLAWMNRHYLKEAEPARIADAARAAPASGGRVCRPGVRSDERVLAFLTACVPLIAGTVDQLGRRAGTAATRLRDAAAGGVVEHLASEDAAAADAGRAVVVAFAQELSARPRLTRETFREAAQQVRQRTGQKGRALFHPIRLALTGADSGPELDLLVPAIDAGADVPRDRRAGAHRRLP